MASREGAPTSLPRRGWLVVLTLTIGCTATPLAFESLSRTPTPAAESSPGTPTPAAESTFGAFRAHVVEAVLELGALLQRVEELDQAQFPDIDAGVLGLAILTWAVDEDDWLRTNLPEDCYAESWRDYDEAVGLVNAGAGHLSDALGGNTDLAITLARSLFDDAVGLLSDLPADNC